MSWKQNNGRDRGHIDGVGYFLKGPNDSIIKAIEPSGNYVSTITNDAGVTKVFLNIAIPTEENQTLSSDLSGKLEWIDIGGADSFVPYVGADKKVNLGAYDLTVQGMTVGLGGESISSNTAIGYKALYLNTQGTNNTANGYQSLYNNTVGIYNTAFGYNALYTNENGSGNIAIGMNSLTNINNGANNTAIGYKAGLDKISGSNCTFIGHQADYSNTTVSNIIVLGNSSITNIYYYGTLSSLSDERDKKEIEQLSYGLDYINEINPVKFLWNMRDGGKIDIPEIGFTAQNLKEVQTKLNINIPNLVEDSNPDQLHVAPGVLIPILVKSIQELSSQLNETNKKLEELTAKVNSIL